MRQAIVVIIAVAFGAVLGMLGARARLVPELDKARNECARLENQVERLNREVQAAAEQAQWLEVENTALRDHVDSLQRGQGLAVASVEDAGESDSLSDDAGSDEEAGSEAVETASASPYQPTDSAVQVRPARNDDEEEALREQERQARRRHVENLVLEDLSRSTDPAEQERLASLHEHMIAVRDLYKELRTAQSPEERQAILDAVKESRRNMKILVEGQRQEMLRKALEEAGVQRPAQQEQLIEAVSGLQETPYWTEPLLIWGMAADDSGGR